VGDQLVLGTGSILSRLAVQSLPTKLPCYFPEKQGNNRKFGKLWPEFNAATDSTVTLSGG